MDIVRSKTLDYTLCILSILSVGSFICYPLGLNFFKFAPEIGKLDINTVGGFGGLIRHSMLLGPTASIASLYLATQSLSYNIERKTKIRWLISIACVLSIFAVFLSASRGATLGLIIGLITLFYTKYKKRVIKFTYLSLIGGIIITVSYPVYKPYFEKVLIKQQMNDAQGNNLNSRSDRWDHRIEEFYSEPLFGIGFSSVDTKNENEYMHNTGSCEPGTSWLAVLSMTGAVGFSLFVLLYIKSVRAVWRNSKNGNPRALLLLSILAFFATHLLIEGYVLAAGSYLSFLFWLTLGNSYVYTLPEANIPKESSE